MKNKTIKVLISFFLTFIFMSFVNAGVKDLNCLDLNVTTYGKSAHFDVKGMTCVWDPTPVRWQKVAKETGGDTYVSDAQAQAEANKLITVTVTDYAFSGGTFKGGGGYVATGSHTMEVPKCGDKEAYIATNADCTATYKVHDKSESWGSRTESYKDEKGKKHTKSIPTCTVSWKCAGQSYSKTEDNYCPYVDPYCKVQYKKNPEHKNFFRKKNDPFLSKDATKECKEKTMASTGDSYYASCKCRLTHNLMCPVYICRPQETVSGACAAEYKLPKTNDDMYCVNPGLNFSTKEGEGGFGWSSNQGYAIDETFDYRDCNTSYQSEGCGYANILIESEWLRTKGGKADLIDYQTINLAMRLYGAHVSSRGYVELSGLGVKKTQAGTDNACTEDAVFLFVPSVYTLTEPMIMNYFEYVTEKYSNTYINAADFANDTKFDFPCTKEGTMCNAGGNRYRKARVAIGLFFNTIMGNSKLKEHTEDLYGIVTTKVKEAELIEEPTKSSSGEEQSRIVSEFGNIEYEDLEAGVEYNCNELDTYDAEIAAHIRPYCQIKMKYIDSNGKEFDTRPEYCTGKHSLRCISRPIPIAICDKKRNWQRVTYTYPAKENDGTRYGGPERLISCDNPTQNQFMYGLIDSTSESDPGGKTPGSTTDGKTESETLELFSLSCNKITCNNVNLRKTDEKCKVPTSENEYNSRKNGDVATGYVKDPSLKCILNASDVNKKRYDFSDVFGVNTNLCRVYCSDEVKYYIPDKVTIKDGLALRYDISVKSYLKRSDNYLISNVVKQKRTCVSEIYYNNFPGNTRWAQIYGFSLAQQQAALGKTSSGSVKEIYNWTDLYKVLKQISGSNSQYLSGKVLAENLNELVYDLYNCNFFDQKVFDDNNVSRPRQRIFGSDEMNQNVYKDFIKKEYSIDNTYGLHGGLNGNNENCSYDEKTGKLSCMSMNTIEYAAGSEMVSGERIGGTGKNNKIDVDNVSSGTLSSVTYCRNSEATDGNCFDYKLEWNTNESEDAKTYTYESMSNKTTTLDGRQIPTNDYAMFTVTTEIGFYNNDIFQTEPSSGKVKKVEEVKDENRLQVDSFSYPISPEAYSLCTPAQNNGKNIFYDPAKVTNAYKPVAYNNCKVVHHYNSFNTYRRMQFIDGFWSEIKNYTPSCYYEVTGNQTQCPPGTKTCLAGLHDIGEYRNVDRSNLFPNANLSEKETNWDTEEGRIAKTEIEDANTDIFTDEKYVEYSFSLSPQQIKNIRVYNRTASSYVDVLVDNCKLTEKGMYLNCRSVNGGLLDEIRKNSQDGSVTGYATILNNKDGSDLFK